MDDRLDVPIRLMLSKYFLRPGESPEREVVDQYIALGKHAFDLRKTRYYHLRTGRIDWLSPGVARLPTGLECQPVYWIMPWIEKRRPALDWWSRFRRRWLFARTYGNFLRVIENILSKGFDASYGRIPVIRLHHPRAKDIFIYTDGNQRMGILSYIADRREDPDFPVPVEVRLPVERETLLDSLTTQDLVRRGYFTEADVFRWFDHPFLVLNLLEPLDGS